MKNGLLHILYLMAILAFHSCSHEWFDGDKRCLNSAVEEARSYFEGNATDLSMPQLMMPPFFEEIEGRNNAITIKDLPNTLELAHTHIDVIYPSIEDLKSIYRRYHKGCISDYENFKYIIVSPEYFVVIKIEDTDRMDVLIRDSLIIQKVIIDDNKYKYEFSEEIKQKYHEFIPIQSNSVEGHFSNFMDFFEYLNPGLSISCCCHKKYK